jgi:hypothetical protein
LRLLIEGKQELRRRGEAASHAKFSPYKESVFYHVMRVLWACLSLKANVCAAFAFQDFLAPRPTRCAQLIRRRYVRLYVKWDHCQRGDMRCESNVIVASRFHLLQSQIDLKASNGWPWKSLEEPSRHKPVPRKMLGNRSECISWWYFVSRTHKSQVRMATRAVALDFLETPHCAFGVNHLKSVVRRRRCLTLSSYVHLALAHANLKEYGRQEGLLA